MRKTFKVAAVSDNTNSFGLTGMILIARDGEAWEVGASYHHRRSKGDLVHIPVAGKAARSFGSLGFEIPHRLPEAPPKVVAEVWK